MPQQSGSRMFADSGRPPLASPADRISMPIRSTYIPTGLTARLKCRPTRADLAAVRRGSVTHASPAKRLRRKPFYRAQQVPPGGDIGCDCSPGRIEDHPTGKFGRVGMRFDVNPTRAIDASDSLTDCGDRYIRCMSQPGSREMVIVQRDRCVEARMCHVVIFSKLAYRTVNCLGNFA